jgi:hypothetical protein
MEITIEQVVALFKKKNYVLTEFNPFGIRYNDNIDLFTDVRGLLRKVGGAWELKTWPQTTKPSTKALKQPVNPLGCALLAEGQYLNSWVIGLHFNHNALKQCAKIKLFRINTKDGNIDITHLTPIDSGPECGIDLHGVWAGNIPDWDGTYPKVDACGDWSEGCQVMARPHENEDFVNYCKASGLKYFNYALFNITDLQNL